jgi:hypothetical protein
VPDVVTLLDELEVVLVLVVEVALLTVMDRFPGGDRAGDMPARSVSFLSRAA